MIIRQLREEEKDIYNQVVDHPLQSWEWGSFRKQTGLQIERIGFFDNGKLKKAIQVTFHKIPVINRTIGYFPKGYMPDEDQLHVLNEIAKKHKAVAIKMEPNVFQEVSALSAHDEIKKFLINNNAKPGRPLFTKHTFRLDLTKRKEELFSNLSSKTRYNVNRSLKKGVKIFENTSKEGMKQYIEILEETTKRQGFYAHTPDYFKTMWDSLSGSGMIKVFNAVYQEKVLVSWVMFAFNGVLYYPYGASRSIHRDVMASNLMMWEMINYGKENGFHTFDMWGSLGENPDKNDPWYGFHRFKKGYGGSLVKFLGTYDLITDYPMYSIFKIGDNTRWKLLKLKTKLKI